MKTTRSILATLAFALACGTATAAPMLKSDIMVHAPVVTVGDMFDDAGLLAEKPLFRSPLPGTAGNVDISAIRAAAGRVGLTQFDINGLTQVRVARAGTTIDEVLLADLIAGDLRDRGVLTERMTASIHFATAFQSVNAAAGDQPARLESLRYLPGNNSFNARFALAGVNQPIDISGTVDLSIDAPHLAAALPAGTVLTPEHIVMRPVPLAQADAQGLATPDQLIGMMLNRQSRDGLLLRVSDVSTPLTIAKNDIVTIYYRQGPMTLTVRGQAVTGAAEGAPLQVLNLVSRRVIGATAIAPGAVEVSTAPITLAGL